jgi:DNA helicase-2/ATP-dependent DNA helicase PcrA
MTYIPEHKTENQEKAHLEKVISKIHESVTLIESHVKRYAKEIQDQKTYVWENKTGMDHAEKISVRQSVTNAALTAEKALTQKKRLEKMMASPYFGRIDFREKMAHTPLLVYIGIHNYYDKDEKMNLIYDWRAPVATLFYDFENGSAYYECPRGQIHGDILLKRQYRIRHGVMEHMIESALTIHDDVLQKELSHVSSEKMKNIVATIQRDQNAIIRNEKSDVLIIQGVAGSGKTSIALHRIAFLLYRFKETLTSENILVLSPNKVFADYISNVLPELGEEKIPEMVIESLAQDILGYTYTLQSFFEQVSLLLEKKDSAFQERIKTKSSFEFLHSLDEYIRHIENTYFLATDLRIHKHPVPAWFIEERFKVYRRLPIFERFNEIARDIEENISIFYNYTITAKERTQIKKAVKDMFKITRLNDLYADFYAWTERPELFIRQRTSRLEYADIFPLIYLKLHTEGTRQYPNVKHLLIDEMQDYTPVQYAVLEKLFTCKKTILGDVNQSVNPLSSSSAESIREIFETADCVKLNKSYRSTYEITQFAERIAPNADLVAIERHGEEPDVLILRDTTEEKEKILALIQKFTESSYQSLGIICKTFHQAEKMYAYIKKKYSSATLLTLESTVFENGIIVSSAHMAKGLEFDSVIIPHGTPENYATALDKQLLYVAATRAMHTLTITGNQSITPFINNK